jgi:MFS transporter, DHA1 family, multidrug resistance protein
MLAIIELRDTPFGQLLRAVGFKSSLQYPEERHGFQPPPFATVSEAPVTCATEELPKVEVVRQLSQKGLTDASVVDWYTNDPDYPRNWTHKKKSWVMVVISLYTFVVYCAASIITPTADIVMKKYNVSIDIAYLGLSLYVAGYAVGPLFFSPLSEIAFVGRNPPYFISFVLFLIVSIVMDFVDNFPALIVLRFLQGFLGSPILATGAASIEDIYDIYSAPFGYIWWIAAMYCGPAIGPLLPAYALEDSWRWPFREVIIMSVIVMGLLPFLPETSPSKLLLHRARRLRQVTGDQSYQAPSELKRLEIAQVFKEAMIKPIEISIKDPAIAFTCVYCAIVYATYYSFFEAFPLVYLGAYRMSLGGLGLIFTSIVVGCSFGLLAYWLYLQHVFIPRARQYHQQQGEPVAQEQWLLPGLLAAWGVPVGLLVFAWTARADVHWIAPTIGIGIFCATSFVVFQCFVCYIPLTYPKYVASLFAANDLVRSGTAAVFVQVTRYMYLNLGIGKGVTVVAGLSGIGVVGMYAMYHYGAWLRARSKFTG